METTLFHFIKDLNDSFFTAVFLSYILEWLDFFLPYFLILSTE